MLQCSTLPGTSASRSACVRFRVDCGVVNAKVVRSRVRGGLARLVIVASGVLLCMACGPTAPPVVEPQPAAAPAVPQSLRMIAVDDSQHIATQLARLWAAETGGQIEVTFCATSDLQTPANPYPAADLWLYPNLYFGEMLASGRLQNLDTHWEGDLDKRRTDLFPLDRDLLVQNGDSIAAVSLGNPLLVLLYRQDVWEALDLPPPRTWRDYRTAAQKIHEAASSLQQRDPPLPSAVCEPWASDWLVEMFFVRAATRFAKRGRLSSYFDIANMDPLLVSPPFVATLEEMATLNPWLGDASQRTPTDCYRLLLEGKAAMAITFVTGQAAVESARDDLPLQVMPLPIAERTYDYRSRTWSESSADTEPVVFSPLAGRLVSLGADSRRIRTALRFLDWLSEPETNRQIGQFASDAAPVTAAAIDPPANWLANQLPRSVAEGWAEIVRDANARALAVGNLRIEHRPEFVAVLQREIAAVIAGSQTAEAGLTAGASEWTRLLEKHGRDELWRRFRATAGVESSKVSQ